MRTKTLAVTLTALTAGVAGFTITLPLIGYSQLALYISAPTTLLYAALTAWAWKETTTES